MANCFTECLESWKKINDIRLLGYVVMPEHVHLVLIPPNWVCPGTGDWTAEDIAGKEFARTHAAFYF